jgi:hypothetical protein
MSDIYKRKRVLLILLTACAAALTLLAAACGGGGNGSGKGGKPVKSIDLLTFEPASPEGQKLTKEGNSPQIIIRNYNETAIDALNRALPTSEECGLPKKDRYVGLFYSLWTSEISAPVDNTKVLATNPYDPNHGTPGGFCFWSEPETGYHKANDVWQIKRDLYYFAMAGVDFLYFDMTNGFLYEKAMTVFLDTCLELRQSGQMTPYVVPWCFGSDKQNSTGDIGKFYRLFMTDEKYADLWFYWDGKPLALIKPYDDGSFPILEDDSFNDKLTFRKSWVGSGEYWWVDCGGISWNAFGWAGTEDNVECVGIGTAEFAMFGSGRSGYKSAKRLLDKFLETPTMGEGILFEQTFTDNMERYPDVKVLLISRWNEWIAQNFTSEMPTDTGYVDQFNREFSRDIEPMKGGFTDNYFYQMCSIIRRFKGVLPADGNTGCQTVDIDGGFGQWQEIAPVFTDFEGDTSHRNSTDTTGRIAYVNNTGRNDIVESRLTADKSMVYVYVRCAEKITGYAGAKNWMLLFIDADNDKSTGWEGYDYLINYGVLSDTLTTVCAYRNNVWQEIGSAAYRLGGSEMMIEIPRSLLGLTGDAFTLNFHWMDNVTDIYSLESWFTTGDSAPERRNNYSLTMKIPYKASDERLQKGRESGRIAYMPGITLNTEERSSLKSGLIVTLYDLPEDYGKAPEFGLLDSLIAAKGRTCSVAPDVIGDLDADYGLVFEGLIKLGSDESKEFKLTCDDSAKLFIDGRLLIDCPYDKNREAGETVEGTCSIMLGAGYHRIRIEYAETKGGQPRLSLEGTIEFYTATDQANSVEVDLSKIKGVYGSPAIFDYAVEVRSYGTVLGLGEMDLSRYTEAVIRYCSDRNAKLDSVGSYFAFESKKASITSAKGNKNVLAKGNMEDAEGQWSEDVRTVSIDLSGVDYSGPLYLAVYMGDFNGVNIVGITFIGE